MFEPHGIGELALTVTFPRSSIYATIESSIYVHASNIDLFQGVGAGVRF